jgi:uncharacterized membrane protein
MNIDARLSQVPFFAHLTTGDLETLAGMMTRETVPAREPVFWIGDHSDALYIVEEGSVAITVPHERGHHVVLETVSPGGVFGELSFLDGGPRTATVRSVTETVLLKLPQDAFQKFLAGHPHVAISMLRVMAARQRVSTQVIRGLENPNRVMRESATRWQRVSDVIATVAASHYFTLIHIVWFGGWVTMNVLATAGILPAALGFDPYPFGLLTLIVSLEAIFLSIFVLVSQNRQSERDRIRTDLDYQVNVKAHVEIMGIVQRLERIERAVAPGVRQGSDTGQTSERGVRHLGFDV